jgi:hypothetical protein
MGPNKLYAQSIYGAEPKTMDELGPAIIQILNQHSEVRISGKKRTESAKARCVGLSWQLRHSDHVSNSHSNPEGFPSNWEGKDGLPTGYPGWSGRVWVRYVREEGYSFGSDPFRRALFHTGTGGGGSYNGPWEGVSSARWHRYGHKRGADMYPEICCYSWDCRVYDTDWPEITANIMDAYEKECMWATLNNRSLPASPSHHFLWEDPDTKAADEAFMKECKNVAVAS